MARIRSSAPAAPSPDFVPFPLTELLDGPRPGRSEPDRDRAWLELRHEVLAAAVACGYDPRAVLGLSAAKLATWRDRRFDALAERFAGDPRVVP